MLNEPLYEVKTARKRKKLTQKQIAELIGISENGYVQKENGKHEFTRNEIIKLSEVLNVSIIKLFFDDGVTENVI